ncbi:MAG: Mut7-C RNAse domain-containing protein [Desulfobacterales bacterium]
MAITGLVSAMHTRASPHAAPPPGAPAFAVERTLGRLGKWLRLLGFDTVLETDCPHDDFISGCAAGRILLTRTHRVLAEHGELNPLLIRADDPFRQIVEVARALGLTAHALKPFSRCLRCNDPVEALAREEARGVVPDYVWQTQPAFSRCPRCRRVYWRGTHTARSLERVETLLNGAP